MTLIRGHWTNIACVTTNQMKRKSILQTRSKYRKQPWQGVLPERTARRRRTAIAAMLRPARRRGASANAAAAVPPQMPTNTRREAYISQRAPRKSFDAVVRSASLRCTRDARKTTVAPRQQNARSKMPYDSQKACANRRNTFPAWKTHFVPRNKIRFSS